MRHRQIFVVSDERVEIIKPDGGVVEDIIIIGEERVYQEIYQVILFLKHTEGVYELTTSSG